MISLILLATATAQSPLACPVMGSPVNKNLGAMVYAGARYMICCGGCDTAFKADPAKALKGDAVKGKTVGEFLFDPVSGKKVDLKKNAGTSDFGGLRYAFETAANKTAFDADPKKFTAPVTKEALFCSVMKHDLKSINDAGGFADVEGTRYYVCCANCLAAFKAEPAKYTGNAKGAVKALKVADFKEKKD